MNVMWTVTCIARWLNTCTVVAFSRVQLKSMLTIFRWYVVQSPYPPHLCAPVTLLSEVAFVVPTVLGLHCYLCCQAQACQ
jgi:hypothetical protein